MSLYVTYADDEPMALTRKRKATPGEALQFALSCRTCDGSGESVEIRGPIEYEQKFPIDCPACVDGIPRNIVETAAEGLKEYCYSSHDTSACVDNHMREATAVLVALRDREETE